MAQTEEKNGLWAHCSDRWGLRQIPGRHLLLCLVMTKSALESPLLNLRGCKWLKKKKKKDSGLTGGVAMIGVNIISKKCPDWFCEFCRIIG